MDRIAIGVVQFVCGESVRGNLETAGRLVRAAAAQGADVVLLPELFAGPYFCLRPAPPPRARAEPLAASRVVAAVRGLAAELEVALPVPFFERDGRAGYNAIALLDETGAVRGRYRQAHVADGPGAESTHFRRGDGELAVWETRCGRIGVGIGRDLWFPEAARALALSGAELLLYPVALGSTPGSPELISLPHWRRVLQGHAAANMLPVAVANRAGTETVGGQPHRFHGGSFIAGPTGEIVADAGGDGEAVLVSSFSRAELAEARAACGVLRSRRPELYAPLLAVDAQPAPTAGHNHGAAADTGH
jgi:N-carbamoylputrescine amidase